MRNPWDFHDLDTDFLTYHFFSFFFNTKGINFTISEGYATPDIYPSNNKNESDLDGR